MNWSVVVQTDLLLDALRNRTAEALQAAYEQYGRMVYNVCRRALNGEHAAEDATQAVFLLLLRKAPGFSSGTHLAGWLYRTAELVSREARRAEARRLRREQEAAQMANTSAKPETNPDQAWQELRPKLDRAVASLPERYRMAIVAVYLQGQSQQQTAQELKVPEGTLRWRLSYGIDLLRKKLRADERLPATLLVSLLGTRSTEAAPPPALLANLSAKAEACAQQGEHGLSGRTPEYYHLGRKAMFFERVRRVSAACAALLLICAGVLLASGAPAGTTPDDVAPRKPAIAPAVKAKSERSLEGAIVRGIEIQGVSSAQAARTLASLQTKEGAAYSRQRWEEDLKALATSGRFAKAEALPPAETADGIKLVLQLVAKNAVISEFSSGPPEMVPDQIAEPDGGRVVLYSRNRFGNYPLASYALHLGLRGDDKRVHNDVNLLFGNAMRANPFKGRTVNGNGNGSAGMDGGPIAYDRLQVNCCGSNRNKILDLGAVDFDAVKQVPKGFARSEDRAKTAAGHVYVIRVWDTNVPALRKPLYFKLKVVDHRDNDAVLLDWAPLRDATAPAAGDSDF